ncbi:hypothetical protein AYI70_g619 [Smittium culicis]|uniref:Uncharacterized protein n=1 Tax=Smittium culicis TaxID=133412 RepID=A0A1R1YFZ8_9FUNG|nr:hypothetical protein AYI70_g619 [Smittium culicis]
MDRRPHQAAYQGAEIHLGDWILQVDQEILHQNAAGQTVLSLANRKAKINKSKIQHWAISRNIKDKGNWIGLTAMHPTLRLGLQDVGRMRMGSYWTAQLMANTKIID